MNCPNCGSAVNPGAVFCSVCNQPLGAGYSGGGYYQPADYQQAGYQQAGYPQQNFPPINGYAGYVQNPPQENQPQAYQQPVYQPQQGYEQQPPVYQASYAQYGQQPNYPTGYQQIAQYGEMGAQEHSLPATLSELPRAFLNSMRNPAEVLRGMIGNGDMLSCPCVAVLLLILTFLGSMVLLRGVIAYIYYSGFNSAYSSAASLSEATGQAINYVAGRLGPAVGGIATLCQIIAMLVPAGVTIVYLRFTHKLRFSWPLLFGLVTVSSLPTVAVTLISMVLSLLSPWLALLTVVAGIVISYTQYGAMISCGTGLPDTQTVPAKLICLIISLLLTVLLIWLVGGSLMNGVAQRYLTLSNIGMT